MFVLQGCLCLLINVYRTDNHVCFTEMSVYVEIVNSSDNHDCFTEMSVPVYKGLQMDTDNVTGDPHYTYNISREFEHWNITQPLNRQVNHYPSGFSFVLDLQIKLYIANAFLSYFCLELIIKAHTIRAQSR